MKLPSITISLYIGRVFFVTFLATLGVLASIIFLIDLMELLRRTAEKPDISFILVLKMAALKLPHMIERILPYAVLVGGMLSFTRLTRSQELAIARAAGISAWQFSASAVFIAFLIGGVYITMLNPLAAAMISRYEFLENKYIAGNTSSITISSSGLWLRQAHIEPITILEKPVNEYILNSRRVDAEGMRLREVTVFGYDGTQFSGRIDAAYAALNIGYWQLEDVQLSTPGQLPQKLKSLRLPTDLRITEIQDSFAEPETLSFWQLGRFISTLERSGFSALKHKIHWQAMLSTPLLLAGMTLIAVLFSLHMPRRGKLHLLVLAGLATGFIVNFSLSLFHAFGYSGGLPVALATWGAPVSLILFGCAALLHYEDG